MSKENNCMSSMPSFADWMNEMQKCILVAESHGCSECTCIILCGWGFSNFVAILAEETKTSACGASFGVDFFG